MRALESLREDFASLDRSRPRLRSFGWVVGGVLLAAALGLAWRADWEAGGLVRGLAAAGTALVLAGAVAPVALRPAYLVWMGFALVLGHVMTRVVLAAVFFLLVTPIGLLMRALGKDPLDRGPRPELPSYWIERDDGAASPERLERYW